MIFSLEQDFSFPEMVNPTVPHMRQGYAVVPTKVMVKVVAIPLASG